jgi:hypothetical protein
MNFFNIPASCFFFFLFLAPPHDCTVSFFANFGSARERRGKVNIKFPSLFILHFTSLIRGVLAVSFLLRCTHTHTQARRQQAAVAARGSKLKAKKCGIYESDFHLISLHPGWRTSLCVYSLSDRHQHERAFTFPSCCSLVAHTPTPSERIRLAIEIYGLF